MSKLLYEELSHSIIGAAMTVLNELRPGLDEKLYERALALELLARGQQVERQKQFPVHYRGELVGTLDPDLIVDDLVIVDTKVVASFCDTDLAQMLGYLTIANLQLAILVNFKYSQLKFRRVIKEKVSLAVDHASNSLSASASFAKSAVQKIQ